MNKNEPDPGEAVPARILRTRKPVRTLVVALGVGSLLAGAGLVLWLLPHGERYVASREPEVALRIVQGMFALLFLSVLPLGAYLLWFGYRAARWRQIPPPGTWVLRDTKVVEGDRAKLRGQIIMILGALLLALGLFSAIYFPHQLGGVFHQGPLQPTAEAAAPTGAH